LQFTRRAGLELNQSPDDLKGSAKAFFILALPEGATTRPKGGIDRTPRQRHSCT